MKVILMTDRLWLWWLKVTQSTEYIFPVTELSVSDHHWYFHKDSVVLTNVGKWVAEIPPLCTMEMPSTVEARHCSPTPEYPFTPEPVLCCEIYFYHHNSPVIFAFFDVQQSLTRSLWSNMIFCLYCCGSLERTRQGVPSSQSSKN